jgi:hypothetical protein
MDDLTSLLESVSISKSQRDKPQLLIGGYKFKVDAKPDGDGGYNRMEMVCIGGDVAR